MKTLQEQIIAKQDELIHQLGLYSIELDMPEVLSEEHLDRINKISMGIKHLESELLALKAETEKEVSDSDIEKWANEFTVEPQEYFLKDVVEEVIRRGLIYGAKAMRDNKIKHTEK